LKRVPRIERFLGRKFAPVRGRGLKHRRRPDDRPTQVVRPRTGARIETQSNVEIRSKETCSPPYGGAD